ncbi:MAG: hypothetical protein SR1Q7_10140 [Quinella sp. 1Q7]|nr:hypothetical protein [Quinella sp. 1Q7]
MHKKNSRVAKNFSARSVRADAVNPTVADALNSATEIFSPQCSCRRRQSDRCRRAQFGDRNFQPAVFEPTPSIRPLPTRSIRRRKFSARKVFVPTRQSDRCRRAQFGDRNFQPAQMSATKKFLGTDLSAEELFRRIYV